MESNNVVMPPALADQFRRDWAQYRVIVFSAPFGTGKTTVAHALLEKQKVCAFTAAQPDFLAQPIPQKCDAILIDDFQLLKDPQHQETLCAWIRENPAKHFVLLGRGVTPGWLVPFQFSGLLTVLSTQDLLFDRETVRQMLEGDGLAISPAQLAAIMEDTRGYPLLVLALRRYLAAGTPYSQSVFDAAQRELFHCIEDVVFDRFPQPLRRLLLALSPFEEFNGELAQLVSGDSRVNELISIILHETTMLADNGTDHYRFWPVFQRFLRWKLQQAYTPAEQATVYSRAGLYYELHDDYAHALDCYSHCGDHAKVSELLVKNAQQHPGLGHYYEMEQYYYAIPEQEVRRSPALMCAMSMLAAITLDYEGSENWYAALQDFAAHERKTSADYKDAQARLAYLDIALPQRGSNGLVELIANVFRVMRDKELKLPPFSVTSTLPSVMNGGKDFCAWAKQDDLLYATMRRPLEAVMGRDGIGLADCAICESKFEKGEDISTRLLSLLSRLTEIHRKGTPDIEFAVIGLMARAQAAQGNADAALATLDDLRDSFLDTGQTRFLPNLDALRCRLWLRLGRWEDVERWYREQAPAIGPRLRAMWRYQYITRAMVEIGRGDYQSALVVTAVLQPYCDRCARVMDGLYLHLLTALCHYRQGDGSWKGELSAVLDTACEYGFIQPVAQFGASALPMLTECGWQGDKAYFDRLVAETRRQAVNYPDFLRPQSRLAEPLSPAELQVLKLLCYDRSNQEIADILGIKVSTIKSHVNRILAKLGVKRRSEAVSAAKKLHLV